jgi:Malectin domain
VLSPVYSATTAARYYAHGAVEDRYGVIAPWYRGQNGQFDFRVRIAAETMKRYPWVDGARAIAPAPEYLYNGKWSITREGRIQVVPETDWNNGDLVQRAANAMLGWERYYAYSGDPAAFTHITAIADYLAGHCQTGADHDWPRMVISVPTHGVRYGPCRLGAGEEIGKNGKIQLDIAAEAGLALVRAYEMAGIRRWYDAARHWADLIAQNRSRDINQPPWGRYAAHSGRGMTGVMNGGVGFVLAFFDELIRTGYTGADGSLTAARDAGRRYLRDVLLPAWTVNVTWGHNYWDGPGPVQQSNVTEFAVQYLMANRDYFPNWENDVRNILGLFLHHSAADPASGGEVYSGAWASPESENCCSNSLAYVPMRLSGAYARYSVLAGNQWAREMSRRQQILATYDMLETGWGEDRISGGPLVYASWFKIAHPMALRNVLGAMAWLPEIMGPHRENHIMRSTSVIRRVTYGKGEVVYEAFDAPPESVDVLRLSFRPTSVTGDGKPVTYTAGELPGGDYMVTVRRDGFRRIEVHGEDPQVTAQPETAGAETIFQFTGNQVRVIGNTGTGGGQADVFLDGIKQLAGIDCYTPAVMDRQVLYYRNGLSPGRHKLRVVATGARNPLSGGSAVTIHAIQYSAAQGDGGFGEGGGPTGAQRFVFGYTGRKDYIDTVGHAWRPGVELVARTAKRVDPVARHWWVMARVEASLIAGTKDPELYLYGVHGPELTVNVTVGPGTYRARLKFAETECTAPGQRLFTIYMNGEKKASGVDLFVRAGGANKAVDLVFDSLQPKHGIIEVRLVGDTQAGRGNEAILQALEVEPMR